jgi:hypothetical protein
MYFPELTRSDEDVYHNQNKTFYANYQNNYAQVSEDCQNRCVYCDITVDECGGDKMQLDHFRPQEHFSQLDTHPHNLYLSCPKCNRLKTSDWPCCKINKDAPSFIGKIGYLNRFTHNAQNYLKVEDDGRITQLAGPVEYMINKMRLNRSSRVNIRRKRRLEFKKTQILEAIELISSKLMEDSKKGLITQLEMIEKIKLIRELSSLSQSI